MKMESCKLFIGRLSWKTTEYREYFQIFCEVLQVVMKDRATGCAHGFGFFSFAGPSVAVRAIFSFTSGGDHGGRGGGRSGCGHEDHVGHGEEEVGEGLEKM
ncbi:hypothetical protein Bca4012_050622 [Brassica carinata]